VLSALVNFQIHYHSSIPTPPPFVPIHRFNQHKEYVLALEHVEPNLTHPSYLIPAHHPTAILLSHILSALPDAWPIILQKEAVSDIQNLSSLSVPALDISHWSHAPSIPDRRAQKLLEGHYITQIQIGEQEGTEHKYLIHAQVHASQLSTLRECSIILMNNGTILEARCSCPYGYDYDHIPHDCTA